MWKQINDKYSISIEGQVRNDKTDRILKPDLHIKGYYRVRICGKALFIHRLVAIHFIPNPLNKPQVNHIDGNKTNNHISNLEWCTNIENTLHSYSISGINKNITNKEQYDSIILYTQQGKKPKEIVQLTGLKRNTVVAIRQGYNGQRFKLVE